jgi:hypothetical protein
MIILLRDILSKDFKITPLTRNIFRDFILNFHVSEAQQNVLQPLLNQIHPLQIGHA